MSKITEKTSSSKYKVKNWSDYNKSLINRGSITFWIEEDVLNNWYYDGPRLKGGLVVYSDQCIECMLGLKAVFKLPYRQTVGFAASIIRLLREDLKVPSYTQVSRRSKELEVDLDLPSNEHPLFLVCDSTGLKVYGEGEWKVRKHGYSKRRTWRKLHLAVDEQSGLIYAQTLTENSVDDASQLEPMLDSLGEDHHVSKVGGDGAYDRSKCWDTLKEWGIEGVIPPREDAVYWVDEQNQLLDHNRNHILKDIEELGVKGWKQKSNYHRRSLSETAMMRFKTIFGAHLFSKKMPQQKTETAIKIKVLNRMTGIGMPISIKIA